jgi:hypothetical protein
MTRYLISFPSGRWITFPMGEAGRVARAQERFEAMGLHWYAAQTQALAPEDAPAPPAAPSASQAGVGPGQGPHEPFRPRCHT